eukprot:gene11324-23701_t
MENFAFPLILLMSLRQLQSSGNGYRQLVISHRGASGYLPEHSLAAYELAMDLWTDYIEPDLCLSKDGVFVAIHDLLLDDVTDVATNPIFIGRNSTKIIDGCPMSGYFVCDFTYDELQQLRLRQRLPGRSMLLDGLLTIPRLEQILTLVRQRRTSSTHDHRNIGIYLEIKHPSFHDSLGFHTVHKLLQVLEDEGIPIRGDDIQRDLREVVAILFQCFEKDTLKTLSTLTDIPLVYLVDKPPSPSPSSTTPSAMISEDVCESTSINNNANDNNVKSDSDYGIWNDDAMMELTTYVGGIGPNKSLLLDISEEKAKEWVQLAHKHNLVVHPWTFRRDSGIGPQFNGSFIQEQLYFFHILNVDAIFTEFPDTDLGGMQYKREMKCRGAFTSRSSVGKRQSDTIKH